MNKVAILVGPSDAELKKYADVLSFLGIDFFCKGLQERQFDEKTTGALVAIPDWEMSESARIEKERAEENNALIFYPKSTAMNELQPIWLWYLREE